MVLCQQRQVLSPLHLRFNRKESKASNLLNFLEFFLVTFGKLLSTCSNLYSCHLELVYLFTKYFLKGKLRSAFCKTNSVLQAVSNIHN